MEKHYKIMYTGNGNDGTAADHVYTLVGYSMFTEFPEVAVDWIKSVQPGYPNLQLQLSDPNEQVLAEALNGLDDDGEELDFDSFYTVPQFGDKTINRHVPYHHGD